ncbi:MAG: c-type cytochrome [bacterium]
MLHISGRTVCALGTLLVLGLTGCYAPSAGDPIPSYDGARLYRENCASCHGKTGAGDGPMVPHLDIAPTNLRVLSAANNGEFPRLAVTRQIDGRDMRAVHGSSDMPVWGWQFSHTNNDMRDPTKQAQARINALVDYLQTVQD